MKTLNEDGRPFRCVDFGSSESENTEHLVVSASCSAADLMLGQGMPFAVCFSRKDAERVARALNEASVPDEVQK